MNVGRGTRRLLTGAMVAALALTLGAGSALADTELGDSGEIGPHSLRDSMSKPGVTCNYGAQSYRLKSLTVRPPRLSSDDAFPAPVGWKVQVQRKVLSGSWKTIYTSSVQHGTASEGHYADFTKRTITPSFPSDPNPLFTDYRVIVVMLQFYGNGSVAGKSRHLVDYYKNSITGEKNGPGWACSREFGIF